MKDDWKRGLPVRVGTALMATILIFSVALNASAQEKDKECRYAGQRLTPEKLEPILKAHALWLEDRKGNGAERAVLCKAQLPGANLQGTNLVAAKLQGANLLGANLQNANLEAANS